MKCIKKLYQQKLICAILICFITGVLVSTLCGFHFGYYTNDDYNISFLVAQGEKCDLFLNYFLSSFLISLQGVFSFNCFVVFQQILCTVALIAIVFVLINRIQGVLGYIISTITCIFVFVSDVLVVQFTQTPIISCAAGMVLLTYAGYHEQRKPARYVQSIISTIFIIVSSLIRFDSFKVCLVLIFVYVVCIFFQLFRIKTKEIIKLKIVNIIKTSSLFLIVITISLTTSIGMFVTSNLIKENHDGYEQHLSYNSARSRIADYKTVSYDGNEEFYNSVGIHSQTELSMFGYDKEAYNSEVLNKIADYSEQIVQKGDSKPVFALKKTAKRFIRTLKDLYGSMLSIKEKLHLPIGNKLFLLTLVIMFSVILLLLLWVRRKSFQKSHIKSKTSIFKSIYYLLIISVWIAFFMTARITDNNILFVPLFLIIVAAMFFDKNKNYIAYILFSLAPIGLYLYQYNFRISYRVTFTFLFPSIIYMLSLIELPKINKKRTDIVKALVYSLMIIGLIIPTALCLQYFYPQCTLSFDMKLREYIDDNSDIVFIIGTPTNACVDKGYYNALLVPDIPKNEIMTAWINSSDFFVKDLQDKQINNILLDSINSNKRIVIEENENNDLDTQKNNYEDFYNKHYFNGNNTIKLVLEKTFEYNTKSNNPERNIKKIGIYRVVQK